MFWCLTSLIQLSAAASINSLTWYLSSSLHSVCFYHSINKYLNWGAISPHSSPHEKSLSLKVDPTWLVNPSQSPALFDSWQSEYCVLPSLSPNSTRREYRGENLWSCSVLKLVWFMSDRTAQQGWKVWPIIIGKYWQTLVWSRNSDRTQSYSEE